MKTTIKQTISKTIKLKKMKKVIIAALALIGFGAASFAQTKPLVKKNEPSKMQVVKKTTGVKTDAKVVAMNKVTKPVTPAVTKAVVKPALIKTVPVVTKPGITKTATITNTAAIAKTNAPLLKKDGTPDKRFKTNQTVAASPLKKDGTADMRYKANKKHT